MSQPLLHGQGDTKTLSNLRRWLISLLLIGLISLSWSGLADQAAYSNTMPTFKKALAAAALARTFNGIISVAQGTEVAIQPVGVGVTLTLGEILDPLNDLVERFSLLALAASVSLGLQMTVGEMVSGQWLSALLTAGGLVYLLLLWRTTKAEYLARAAQVVAALLFMRFLLVFVLLITHLLNIAFLNAQQDTAMAQLSATSTTIEQMQHEQQGEQTGNAEDDFLGRTGNRLKNLFDGSSQSLDLRTQLAKVQTEVESSVEDMIRLISIFILQTLLLPLASLWICWKLLQGFWRWCQRKPAITPPAPADNANAG